MAILSWHAEWNAISARIDGLVRACEFYYLSVQKSGDDPYSVPKNILIPESGELYACLKSYNENHENSLPEQAAVCLKEFLVKHQEQFSPEVASNMHAAVIRLRLTALSSLRSQIEYHLAGIQDQIRATVERAFLHLQRCIVADCRYREQWQKAYKDGETDCEKLGAVHLLWHGIWAFKAYAEGGRTDLVTGSQIDNPSAIEQTALGMVLTEWKKASGKNEVNRCYESGIEQASLYSRGHLAGIELTDTRYIVVVTTDSCSELEPRLNGGFTYKFINIAVQPATPSVASKKQM